jgi:hypothetical protein
LPKRAVAERRSSIVLGHEQVNYLGNGNGDWLPLDDMSDD